MNKENVVVGVWRKYESVLTPLQLIGCSLKTSEEILLYHIPLHVNSENYDDDATAKLWTFVSIMYSLDNAMKMLAFIPEI